MTNKTSSAATNSHSNTVVVMILCPLSSRALPLGLPLPSTGNSRINTGLGFAHRTLHGSLNHAPLQLIPPFNVAGGCAAARYFLTQKHKLTCIGWVCHDTSSLSGWRIGTVDTMRAIRDCKACTV